MTCLLFHNLWGFLRAFGTDDAAIRVDFPPNLTEAYRSLPKLSILLLIDKDCLVPLREPLGPRDEVPISLLCDPA